MEGQGNREKFDLLHDLIRLELEDPDPSRISELLQIFARFCDERCPHEIVVNPRWPVTTSTNDTGSRPSISATELEAGGKPISIASDDSYYYTNKKIVSSALAEAILFSKLQRLEQQKQKNLRRIFKTANCNNKNEYRKGRENKLKSKSAPRTQKIITMAMIQSTALAKTNRFEDLKLRQSTAKLMDPDITSQSWNGTNRKLVKFHISEDCPTSANQSEICDTDVLIQNICITSQESTNLHAEILHCENIVPKKNDVNKKSIAQVDNSALSIESSRTLHKWEITSTLKNSIVEQITSVVQEPSISTNIPINSLHVSLCLFQNELPERVAAESEKRLQSVISAGNHVNMALEVAPQIQSTKQSKSSLIKHSRLAKIYRAAKLWNDEFNSFSDDVMCYIAQPLIIFQRKAETNRRLRRRKWRRIVNISKESVQLLFNKTKKFYNSI
uniref:Uncharacterized protein n=1 Tax=Spongospora subterranea TaxID=70186 RepID=A0A0H5QM84_9EUKA|eukprot:CRZ03113.1 hypothetical protein [Spongospora subterranea]